MTNFIPIFPLSLVAFPNEKINLHIFEPRYIQLINECNKTKKPFGIPVVIDDKLTEIGTLVKIIEITKVYANGEMDIKTEGVEIFRILEVLKDLPEKLYSGAIVSYPTNIVNGNKALMKIMVATIKNLHAQLKTTKQFNKPDEELWSYDVAHHIGLSLKEEYDFLQLMQELQRQEFLKQHLKKIVPIINEIEILKERIQLNGHFKNISGFEIK